MTIFDELGTRVAKEWRKSRYEARTLPDIAAAELERLPLHREIDYPAILDWVASTETLTPQVNLDATFGEPPLTMFWHPHFYIEALFWSTSTTAVHGHGFSGAFQVLAGTSLQSLFCFTSPDAPGARCRLGQLQQTSASLLRTGATQRILGGEDFVHSVFHLGYPSVTIVIRTFGLPGLTQYTYYRPGVAIPHGLTLDHLTKRLLQVAKLQAVLKSDQLRTTATAIADRCELAAAFALLHDVLPILSKQGRPETAADLILILAAKHGLATVTKLAHALTLEADLDPLRRARDVVIEDDLRLFLALLLTRQGRHFVMPQVTDYTGAQEPQEKVAGWIRELAARGVLNVRADDCTQPFLEQWLSTGQPAVSDGGPLNAIDAARTVAALKAEPHLAPLLFEDAA